MPQSDTDPEFDVTTALQELPSWNGDARSISRAITCPTFPAAITLVDRVAEVAEAMNHHPDIDIRWRTVTFTATTHDRGGVTELDIELARTIDRLAADL